jgi:hypothetical protein
MSSYYKGNAIYQYISDNNIKRFEFVVGDCWQLVYGNQIGDPKLLVFAFAYTDDWNSEKINQTVIKGYEVLLQLSLLSKLPILFIGFNQSQNMIDSVVISNDLKHFNSKSLSELTQIFKSHGLPLQNTKTNKYLNDKTSSAYHKWQRDQLGKNLVVSDIDLWLMNDSKPFVIFELKRSIISLEKWKPYKDDYSNFILLTNLCQLAGIKFFILYNVREKNPTKDIIDRIKIFHLKFDNILKIEEGKIYQINQLIK